MYMADALSRAPLVETDDPADLPDEVETFIATVVSMLPATEQRLESYRQAQAQDTICTQVMDYGKLGWPKKQSAIPSSIVPYWTVMNFLTIHNNLLLYNNRIVVPLSLQNETLQKLHEGHQGIEKCRMRTRSSVWWPGITEQVSRMIQQCPVCTKEAQPRREPLLPSPLPQYPWHTVGTDLFELKGNHYLAIVDYFSRYPEVIKLTTTTSTGVIKALQSVFSRHGIPEIIRSDNGPQYSSHEFSQFANSYGFSHMTSSPHYPQSNGQAERTVQTVKRLLKRSKDPYMALLSYRATPLPWCNLSPTELLMGRRIRTQSLKQMSN